MGRSHPETALTGRTAGLSFPMRRVPALDISQLAEDPLPLPRLRVREPRVKHSRVALAGQQRPTESASLPGLIVIGSHTAASGPSFHVRLP